MTAAAAADYPRALTEIVEDEAELDKRPAQIDILPTHMAHVGVERLRAGGGEEHAAEYHEADLVIGAEKHPHGVDGVKGAQHGGHVEDPYRTHRREEEEPCEHDGTEGLAYSARPRALEREKHGDYNERYDHDGELPAAEQLVHAGNAPETLDRRGDGDGGGEYAVREQRRAPSMVGKMSQPPCSLTRE